MPTQYENSLRIPAYNALTDNGVPVSKMKLPYSGLENLPRGTYCPNVIGGCGNKQAENKTRQLYKRNFPVNIWEAITGYRRASWPQAEVPSAIGEKEKRKSTNKHGKFKPHSLRASAPQKTRLKVKDSAPKTPTFRQAFAFSSVSKNVF